MKCSFGISNFFEEVSSLSLSIVFLSFFTLITGMAFLSLPAILWNSAFKWVYLSFSPLPFAFLLFTAICKASSDNHFSFLPFLFLGDGLDYCLLYNVTNLHPWDSPGKSTGVGCYCLLLFRYDLNQIPYQIPYDYTVEVRNRFKGLGLIDRVPDELWTQVCDIVQEAGIKTIPKVKKKKKNAKRLNGCLRRPYKQL